MNSVESHHCYTDKSVCFSFYSYLADMLTKCKIDTKHLGVVQAENANRETMDYIRNCLVS